MTEKSITLEDGDESFITFEKRCVYLYVYGCMFWGVRRGDMGNYALLHCIGVWRKSPIEALPPSFSPLFLPH